jgi:hypothetical protein
MKVYIAKGTVWLFSHLTYWTLRLCGYEGYACSHTSRLFFSGVILKDSEEPEIEMNLH